MRNPAPRGPWTTVGATRTNGPGRGRSLVPLPAQVWDHQHRPLGELEHVRGLAIAGAAALLGPGDHRQGGGPDLGLAEAAVKFIVGEVVKTESKRDLADVL